MSAPALTLAPVDDLADTAAALIVQFAKACAAGRTDLMDLVWEHAEAVDPDLLDELDGFYEPAAA